MSKVCQSPAFFDAFSVGSTKPYTPLKPFFGGSFQALPITWTS